MNKKEALIICAFFAFMAVTGFNCSDDTVTNNGGDHQFNVGVVSTEWLESNFTMKDLLIIDVRSAETFSSGHIENSINIPFDVVSDWTVMKGDLLLEVPEISQLTTTLGQNGISRNNKVVLVGGLPSEQDPFALAAPTRVALTLAYAGVQNLAILDGCFNKWQDEGRKITTATTVKTAVSFEATANNNLFVDINYLKSKHGAAIVVDARDANVYSGEVIEPFADKAGHIPGTVSLPAPSLWNDKNGTYKTMDQIATLASSKLGQDKNKEIILYCGVGGYASSAWFALTQILDYKNVKIYDGSAQEWVIENEMECSAGINCGDHQFNVGVVSTEWLESNFTMKDLLIIDVRSAETFSSGHIENSINIPFDVVSDWTVMKGDLLLEVPEISQLTTTLGQNGISRNNKVVLVGGLPSEQDPFALAAPTRVALTLAYAGVQNLAILDGCFNKWQDEGRKITTATTVKTAVSFEAAANNNLFVDINYLKSKQGATIVVDARDANVYSGEVIEPFADKAGHIPGAVSLPAPSLWNDKNGTYKTMDQIATLASSKLGQDKNKEIILYCGVGGYASSAWFALTQILDYKNVKIYDGSAQEWVIENEMECSAGINCGDHQFNVGVVSTGWLDSNLTMKDLLIVDVRSAEAFSSGHIENSINIPFDVVSAWTVMKGDLLVELPEITQLTTTLGQNGISRNNKVVLVGGLPSEQDPFALAAPTRVALTLAYAGVQNLAILDGCFNKWQDEGRKITTATTVKTAISFEAAANNNLFVDINYLKSKQGATIVVDARDANVYSGEVIEPFADKAGHIPGAVSLPAPSLWNDNGTYKTMDQIATLASSKLGQDKNKEIILYCGVGGYASSAWFALTQILDYKNVKIYDGSAQEWVIENEMELTSGL